MDLSTFLNFAAVIQAAQATVRVARLMPDGDVLFGTARRVAGDTSNVETCSLEVTLDSGLEVSWPISDLADQTHYGEFVVNPTERSNT
ncbi:MAG: hypothetical protein ABR616_17985 [Dermatophilaceae bacterium]